MLADFHLHSNHSDGRLDPTALVETVAAAGVGVLALTDHDTTAGHAEAAWRCDERGVRFVPGIEMTTFGYGRVIHVLGLGIDAEHPQLEAANATAHQVWDANERRWIDSLAATGSDISFERDFYDHPVRLPVLIERLCRRSIGSGNPLTVHGLFRTFFANLPEEAYGGLPSPAAAAGIIQRAGGVALLAHPDPLREEGIINELIGAFDGLEAMYMAYTDTQRAALRSIAEQHAKLYSCGSDYHGYFTTDYRRPPWEAPHELLQRLGI